MATKVIHIKDAPAGWRNDPDYVFIGRPGKWGNPYYMDSESVRNEVCDAFERYLHGGGSMLDDIDELKGKILVCYCAPKRCHGHSLAKAADTK